MEDVNKRLKEATEQCLIAHDAWIGNKKDSAARESLMDAVHELRKVAARMEIEIAISERDQMASKPIPIPSHRSKRKQSSGDDAAAHNGDDDNRGNKGQPTDDNSGKLSISSSDQGSSARQARRRRAPGGGGGKPSGD